ncbi:hypothetical protein ACHAQJ_008457 [Trichoderma viride]
MAPTTTINGDSSEMSATARLKAVVATSANGGKIIDTQRPNPSLQATADHCLKLVEAPVPEPGHGEVLLHIRATGICGSDVHFWKSGRIGSLVFEGDCILGHEAAGVVLKCGEGVMNVLPGDRVAIEPGVPCGECFLCLDGKYNLCEDVKFSGVYPYAGTIQRYKVHPAKWLHKLPANISFAEGALLEPLSVVIHGIRTAGLNLGCGTVICGAGPIGLIALAAARASGAHPIVITDIEPKRLQFAQEFVPSCRTYLVDASLSAEENGRRIRRLFRIVDSDTLQDIANDLHQEYYAPRTVLECTGVESSVCTAAFTVRRGGTICIIGVGKSIMNNLPFMHISLAEIELKFINRYRDTWPAGIACLSGGILDLRPLVTHVHPLEDSINALHLAADPRNGSIKIQIVDEADEKALQ